MSGFCQKAMQAKNARRDREASQAQNVCRRNCLQDQETAGNKKAFQDRNVRRIALAAASAALLALALCACQSLKRAAAPVAIFDARVVERQASACGESCWQDQNAGALYEKRCQAQDAGGDICLGVEFTAVNLSGRPVKSAVFYASVAAAESDASDGGQEGDWGGETYEARRVLQDGLDPGGEERVFIPLEDVPPDCDADSLEIQSLCVESAEYEDGPLVFFE